MSYDNVRDLKICEKTRNCPYFILLKFQDNTKDVVSVKLRQKINILDQFLFKKYQDFKNNNSITYNYISIDDKTKMLANNVLNKQKTFQSQGILKNSTIVF